MFLLVSSIILFNLAVSTTLEQAMEFCVALMLTPTSTISSNMPT